MSNVRAFAAKNASAVVQFIEFGLPSGSRILSVVASSDGEFVVTYLEGARKFRSAEFIAHVDNEEIAYYHSNVLPKTMAAFNNKVELSLVTYNGGILYRFKVAKLPEGSDTSELCRLYGLTTVNS